MFFQDLNSNFGTKKDKLIQQLKLQIKVMTLFNLFLPNINNFMNDHVFCVCYYISVLMCLCVYVYVCLCVSVVMC